MASSPRVAEDRPKSSLTLASEGPAEGDDSDVDLPRNSHREVRANPCCGRRAVGAWSGAVPKTCGGGEERAERAGIRQHLSVHTHTLSPPSMPGIQVAEGVALLLLLDLA